NPSPQRGEGGRQGRRSATRRDHGKQNVRGVPGIVVDLLPRNDGVRLQGQVVAARVEVAQVVREIAARNLHADAMPLLEEVPGPAPEADRVFVDLPWLDGTQLPWVKGPAVARIAAACPHHAVAKQRRVSVGMNVD